MITKALVTGGAGFIGSNLVTRLVDDGAEVLAVDDLSTGKLERLADARRSEGLTFHQMDIRAPEIHELVEKSEPEVVFHLAAQIAVPTSVLDPTNDASINVVGTVNLLKAAADAGAERFVFTSSGGCRYGDVDVFPTSESQPLRPDSPYGISKNAAEEYLRYFHESHGLDYMALGLSNVYGPAQDPYGEAGVVAIFTKQMLAGKMPKIFGTGKLTRDYVYVEDVVDAQVRAAEIGGARYLNIGTGVETSVLDLFEHLQRLAGLEGEPEFGPARPGDIPRSCLDASAAKEHLGWEAWTPLEDGLGKTVDWFREN